MTMNDPAFQCALPISSRLGSPLNLPPGSPLYCGVAIAARRRENRNV
jgi:hypothetical protein